MMIKSGFLAGLYLSSLLLFGCSNHSVHSPDINQDAAAFTRDGLQAFSEADRYRAKHLFNEALSIYEGIDNQKGLLETHINLAEVALSERNYHATQQHLQLATERVDSTIFQPYQTRIALLYAQIALQQKHYPQAKNLLQPLLPKFEDTVPNTIPDTIQLTAIANRTKIAFSEAQDETLWTHRYAHALSVSKQINHNLTGRLLRFQARLAEDEQNHQQAEKLLRQALIEYKKDLGRTGIAATLSELGQLSMAQERWQDARIYLLRCKGVLHSLDNLDTMTTVIKLLIKVETKLNNTKASKSLNKWLTVLKGEHKGANYDNSIR